MIPKFKKKKIGLIYFGYIMFEPLVYFARSTESYKFFLCRWFTICLWIYRFILVLRDEN